MIKKNVYNLVAFLRCYKSDILSIILGASYFILLIYIFDLKSGDYQSFLKEPINMFYGIDRWLSWSSRLLIENSVNIFSKNLFAWSIITVLLGSVMFWSIGRLLSNDRIYHSFLIFGIMMLVNFYTLTTAGIFATTINYMWPISCLLFVYAVVLRPLSSKALNTIAMIVIWPMYIFAMCSEQLSVLSFVLLSVYLIYKIYKKEHIKKTIILLLIISILGILNVFICPGNELRVTQEIANWWPEFINFSIKEKIIIGLTVTFSRVVLAPDMLFVTFTLLIFLMALIKRNIKAFMFISPVLMIICLLFFSNNGVTANSAIWLPNIFTNFRNIGLSLDSNIILGVGGYNRAAIALFGVMGFLCIMSVIMIYGKVKKSLVIVTMAITGLAVSLMVGLSPTIFISGTRTLYPFMITMLIVDVIIAKDLMTEYFQKI